MTGAPARPGRLRVVTWNIRAAIGPGEPFPPAWWRHVRIDRLARIAAILRALEPDVVALQEVTIMTPDGAIHDQPAELARLTGLYARYAAVHSFPLVEPESGRAIGSAMWGNALLTRVPLVDGFAIGLPRARDDDPVETDDAVDPRTSAPHPLIGVRYADADPGHREPRCVVGGTLPGSLPVTVATTHLTYIGRDQRRRQAEALRDAIAASSGPAVLTGDFNAPIDAAEVAMLGEGLVDAFTAYGVPADDPRRQSCGRWPIDHILVRDLTVDSCRIAREAGDASDHWPVVADLSR